MTEARLSSPARVLVLGIGNLLWADEGFGVRCVEFLAQGWRFPASVTLMDGGTQGLYLLPYVREADALLVFDALDYGDPPGTLREITGEDVPRFMGVKKMSLHQTGFQEVLAAASLLGGLPRELVLLGVQAENLEDYGGSLTPAAREKLPAAAARGLDWLARWGVPGTPVSPEKAGESAPPFLGAPLALPAYETGRPSPAAVWRHGDARFFAPPPTRPGGA
ncbi:MAG: HyaD/HybD family hydrogenase maturation endopeptidase [Zoogloeaceae bacterium]|jgi:hydrogenase maturation protease|nr:HyaD/HybD family hydrogenase maturation endopeptidase [Zoogloeaceae bacterium]